MKYTNLLASAVLLASVSLANAAPTASPSQSVIIPLDSIDDSGVLSGEFSHRFPSTTQGQSFLDVYTFTIGTPSDLGSSFSSPAIIKVSGVHTSDLSFSSFNLYSSSSSTPLVIGKITSDGQLSETPFADSGALRGRLIAGTYSLQIAGNVVGVGGGKYSGDIIVSPVPEPETWGMTIGGLAAVGFLARRRKASDKFA